MMSLGGTYVVLAVRPGTSQQQHLGALRMAVLTGQVQRRVSCLKQDQETGVRRSELPRSRSPQCFLDLVLGVDVGSSLHQQLDRLAEAVPGHLVQRCVAVLHTGSDSRLVIRCLGADVFLSWKIFFSFDTETQSCSS